VRIDFDWDPAKAAGNAAKHGVTFEEAMTVFHDPLARSIVDHDPASGEERWATLGETASGNLLVIVHLGRYGFRRERGAHHFGASADRERSTAIPRESATVSDMKDDMKDEYDFSKAERGRFFRHDATLAPPVHLDAEVLSFLTERAAARGIPLNELINELLKKDIELIEAVE